MHCNLMYSFLKFALPEDMTDVDLKVHMLKGSTHLRRTTSPKHQDVVHGEQKCSPIPPLENDEGVYVQETRKPVPYANKIYHPK